MRLFNKVESEEIMAAAKPKYISHTFTEAGTEYTIEHKLKRIPKVWRVCNLSAPAIVYGSADSLYLKLKATAPCTVILEVVR